MLGCLIYQVRASYLLLLLHSYEHLFDQDLDEGSWVEITRLPSTMSGLDGNARL